jgi:hypothetical protein
MSIENTPDPNFDFAKYTRGQAFEICGDPELVGRIVEAVADGGVFPDLVEGEDGLPSALSDATKRRLKHWLLNFWGDIYSEAHDAAEATDISYPILEAAIAFAVNANLALARSEKGHAMNLR